MSSVPRIFSYLLLMVGLGSCTKLSLEMPIQIINLDGSREARFFEEKLTNKLERRNFIIVRHDTPLKLFIQDFTIRSYHRNVNVHDDCGTGYNSFTLTEEELDGVVILREDELFIDRWDIQAANYDVLKENDPVLIQILFPDEEDEECSDYWVKSRERMNANLRACARRVAAQATKKVNHLN